MTPALIITAIALGVCYPSGEWVRQRLPNNELDAFLKAIRIRTLSMSVFLIFFWLLSHILQRI